MNIKIPIISFVIIFGAFYLAITRLADSAGLQQLQALENAVRKDVLHCFASEGEYPESIEYLEKNYALSYDHDRFEVYYVRGDGNVLPEIKVLAK